MNTNSAKVLHKELSFEIVAAAMEVLNTLGHGLNEKVYENSLVTELKMRGINVDQQKRFKVLYKNVVVGDYIPDLVVDDKVIVDTKVIEAVSDAEVGQVMNYLRIAKMELGIILNFPRPRLESRRVALSD
ncbi:MAG: GxxExxY protein [Verrucomicrobiia bacterium]|jgi:GxxExxY protein